MAAIPADKLKAAVAKIAALDEERAAIDADIDEILAEAERLGLDPVMVREVARVSGLSPSDRADELGAFSAHVSARTKYLKAAGVIE